MGTGWAELKNWPEDRRGASSGLLSVGFDLPSFSSLSLLPVLQPPYWLSLFFFPAPSSVWGLKILSKMHVNI
jgi:hypothetical protein